MLFMYRKSQSDTVVIQYSLVFQVTCFSLQGPQREEKGDEHIHVKEGKVELKSPEGRHQIYFLDV